MMDCMFILQLISFIIKRDTEGRLKIVVLHYDFLALFAANQVWRLTHTPCLAPLTGVGEYKYIYFWPAPCVDENIFYSNNLI